MADSLDQITRELNAAYEPSRKSINDRIAGLGAAEQADIQELDSQRQYAFDDIMTGARERGVGGGGIPLGDQATFTGKTYVPAVSRIKSSYVQQRGSLADALAGIDLDMNKTAQSLRQSQLDRDFQAEQARLNREAEERSSARSAAAQNASWSQYLGDGQASAPKAASTTNDLQQVAYNDVRTRINSSDDNALRGDYRATERSALRGNAKDKIKLELYAQMRPDLFGKGVSGAALANGNQLRF